MPGPQARLGVDSRPLPMATTLVAVILVLLLGHFVRPLAGLRQYDWFVAWLGWLGREGAALRGLALPLGLLLPLAVLGLLQWGWAGWAYGLFGLLLGVAALFYAWGPRDLDLDVEAVVAAEGLEARREVARPLFPQHGAVSVEGGPLVEAVFRCALWRWFGPLFWFLLLGPVGAVGYRLVALSAQGAARERLPQAQGGTAATLLALLDWPVAQLMTLTLALAADFDAVIGAWRQWHAEGIRLGLGHLEAAARASVAVELAEEDAYAADGPAQAPALLELRDAMSLVWRILVIWMGVLALFVVAGFVG
ncbi:MAG: membrane protein [Silanimonas sp.]|nr:MAG: membrane protein [Silanimonas sp.]